MTFLRGLFRLWLIASLLWMATLVVYIEVEGRRRDVADGGSVFVKAWTVIADGWKAERELAAMREVAAVSDGMFVAPDETSRRIETGRDVQKVALLFGGLLLGPPLILLVLGAWVVHG